MVLAVDDTPRDPVGRALTLAPIPGVDHHGVAVDDLDELRRTYTAQGYAVVRGVVPPELGERAHDLFAQQVKRDRRAFHRLVGTPSVHTFTEAGFMREGLLNAQSLERRRHGAFRQAALDVVTHPRLVEVVAAVVGEHPKVVQTMYFEGNPTTQPHQDTYYLDAEPLGAMVGAWIAVEEIDPGAGRFYVVPGSHRFELPGNGGNFDIAAHYDRYLAAVREALAASTVEAPALAAGDVLLWSSRTIHGSLDTTRPARSRRSFTAHYVADSARYLQWQRRAVPLVLRSEGGVAVHHPKDQARWRHRALLSAQARFPTAYARAKQVATKALVR